MHALNQLPSIPSDSFNFTICSEHNYEWYSIQLSEESFTISGRIGEETTMHWEISQEEIQNTEGSLFDFSSKVKSLLQDGAKILMNEDEDD